jgi:hypothetical protein
MIRTRTLNRFTIAIAVACLAWTGVMMVVAMPAANADTLPNGLSVTCTQESDIHATCVVSGCPRVNGDYVVDAIHAMINGGAQSEDGYKCINGATARYGVDNNGAPVNIGVQGCRKKDLEGDWCTPYSNYTFTPPAKPQVQAPPPKPVHCTDGRDLPPGSDCAQTPAPQPPVQCPDDSPVKTVPAGQTCPPPKAVTNAITATFDASGLTTFSVTVKNSSKKPATCSYEAQPSGTTRTFDVAANGSDTESFDGLKTGTNYNIKINCTDSSGSQTEPLGSVNKTVKW